MQNNGPFYILLILICGLCLTLGAVIGTSNMFSITQTKNLLKLQKCQEIIIDSNGKIWSWDEKNKRSYSIKLSELDKGTNND